MNFTLKHFYKATIIFLEALIFPSYDSFVIESELDELDNKAFDLLTSKYNLTNGS